VSRQVIHQGALLMRQRTTEVRALIEDIQTLFDYSYWANDRLCVVLSQLTTEQFTQPVAGSYGSIRNTMVHMLSAEWGWLERCGGAARGPALSGQDYPTVTSLFDQWHYVEGCVREFLSTPATTISRGSWSLRSAGATGRYAWNNCCTMRPSMAFIIGVRSPCCCGCSATFPETSTSFCTTRDAKRTRARASRPERCRNTK
jgi:hypothetical protein